ncbi:hypothetical protein [Actinoallomurus vinaceus]|uniref:hypothetical protein n=1 Tax=Actinoallomurus vinaceus TaxID=1080074 RepID=UPI0031E4F45A
MVELSSGSTVLTLDRGQYHVETTPFPITFLRAGRTTAVVAATDWNRLDAFDLSTGRLLTERDTTWTKDQPPEHALNYFHGALRPSPGENWLLDDGWVWSPVGVPVLIDVAAWLAGEVYATEHGWALSYRDYAWDQPAAWIDDDTVAIQRIGPHDKAMIDGVELFDAPSGRRIGMFAGPAGMMWAHEGLLYVSATAGLEVWDPAHGVRTGLVSGFGPVAHNPVSGAFAEMAGDRLRTWTPST